VSPRRASALRRRVFDYALQHALQLPEDVAAPEPHHPVALPVQPPGTIFVPPGNCLLAMLSSVHFHDQSLLKHQSAGGAGPGPLPLTPSRQDEPGTHLTQGVSSSEDRQLGEISYGDRRGLLWELFQNP